jgi:hypothetical protein
MCCATNRPNTVYQNKCRPDDLCVEGQTENLWRESCTDPTWKDPACLPLCISGICNNRNYDFDSWKRVFLTLT